MKVFLLLLLVFGVAPTLGFGGVYFVMVRPSYVPVVAPVFPVAK